VLALQLAANLFLALGIALAAVLSDRTTPRRVLIAGAVATVVLGLVFGPAIAGGTLTLVFLTLAAALLVMGSVYGPLGGWMPTLFPVTLRYTGISIAFNVGGILGGAVAPIAAQMLSAAGGASLVGLFLTAAGLVTLLGVTLGKPTAAG